MARTKITTQKTKETFEVRRQRLDYTFEEFTEEEYRFSIHSCFLHFIVSQEERGNAEATIDYYKRFYKKFSSFVETLGGVENVPITALVKIPAFQLWFVKSMGEVSIQTVNNYLRAYRAFGKFCEEEGYIDGFKCPIKEVEPPIKQVYTDEEIAKLLVKPKIENFEQYRNYIIVVLMLATGARSNTLLNIKISDVNLYDGTVVFNTTKAHKTVVIPIEKKALKEIKTYINYWGDCSVNGYLFFNSYGEQLTRGGLTCAIRNYNKRRGVEKTSLHLFRHTFVKRWLTNGGDMFILQKILTHSELEMVKRYANIYDVDMTLAVDRFSVMAQTRVRSGQTVRTTKRNQVSADYC